MVVVSVVGIDYKFEWCIFVEDDFFGPVSANFIRPGKLSDSGASGDNHDLTMDSTAFSLHYRSLARSDSGELRTPTKVRLAFDEKTPSHVGTGSDLGSFMVLTRAKKSNLESPSGVEKSDGRDSNDMSLVGEGMRSYDYGRLSPRLEALLAGGSKDLDGFSVLDQQEKEMGGVVGIPVQLEEANLADNPIKLTPSLQSKEWTSNHLGIVQSSNQLSNVRTLLWIGFSPVIWFLQFNAFSKSAPLGGYIWFISN